MGDRKTQFWFTSNGFAATGLIAAATYFLLVEHREHVWQFLPFLILLACPMMHFFMHGSHGGNRDEQSENAESEYQRGLEDGRKMDESQRRRQLAWRDKD